MSRRASASMPVLGSTPTTRPMGFTMPRASRATAPVPTATSRTIIEGASPARRRACRRCQAPDPKDMNCVIRS